MGSGEKTELLRCMFCKGMDVSFGDCVTFKLQLI